jgi:threonine synthase
MKIEGYTCSQCGQEYKESLLQRCQNCQGVLEPLYSEKKISRAIFSSQGENMWAFRDVLPIRLDDHIVTLGEGITPLILSSRLGEKIGIERLWLKLETVNPTGTFKDRGLSVAMSYAVEHGAKGVIGASSGNALHAQAAYAASAGVPSVALVPENVPQTRLCQPIVTGTKIFRIRGNYSKSHELASILSRKVGWYNTSTTYENPIVPEGYKTVSYEISQQLKTSPDWVVIPVGAGPLLAACARGFTELYENGLVSKIPAMLGIQPNGCAPIARAFAQQKSDVTAWEEPIETNARGIADPLRGYSQDGTYTLKWVHYTAGAMVAVSDKAIAQAGKLLAEVSGVYAEPSAAASVAGVTEALRLGLIDPSSLVVCLITGSGFKENTTFGSPSVPTEIFESEKNVLDWLVNQSRT